MLANSSLAGAINNNSASNLSSSNNLQGLSSVSGLSSTRTNESILVGGEDCGSGGLSPQPSRPLSSASDSSESSTESSTTSEEDDEDQEVTFNTIKRRQTAIHVIAPASPSSSSAVHSNDVTATDIALSAPSAPTERSALPDGSAKECDETKAIAANNCSNGDDVYKLKAVGDNSTTASGDGNDDDKENSEDEKKDATNTAKNLAPKVNGDKNESERTQNSTSIIGSVFKVDQKSSNKKEQKNQTSATSNSMNNSSNEEQHVGGLSGIVLPARFKKVNSKSKKSTIRKSDLRNSGATTDGDKTKLSK